MISLLKKAICRGISPKSDIYSLTSEWMHYVLGVIGFSPKVDKDVLLLLTHPDNSS